MKTRDDLYDVAFRYKKAGLWKQLLDSDRFFFAVRRILVDMARRFCYNASDSKYRRDTYHV